MNAAMQASELPSEDDAWASGMRLLVVTVVLVVLVVGLVAGALLVHRSALDTRAEADRVRRVAAQEARTAAGASGDLVALQQAAGRLDATLGALMSSYRAQIQSQNGAVDAANRAADTYNAGQGNVAEALKVE